MLLYTGLWISRGFEQGDTVKISWSREKVLILKLVVFNCNIKSVMYRLQQPLGVYKTSISRASGWTCLHMFMYFTNTQAYQTKSLIEGLETCFRRNQGRVCTKTASCCVSSETAISRNAVTQQSNRTGGLGACIQCCLWEQFKCWCVFQLSGYPKTVNSGISLIEQSINRVNQSFNMILFVFLETIEPSKQAALPVC